MRVCFLYMFTLVIIANCICSGSSIHEPYLIDIPFPYAENQFYFQSHSEYSAQRFVVKSEIL